MADATLDDAVEELYGLVPSAFVAARTRLAAAAPDRGAAERIRSLRKPSTSAWVANMLARRAPGDLVRLAAVAAEAREAQDDRDAARLTTLNADRRMLVAELIRRATAIAEEQGVGVGAGVRDELERTLGAAARDEQAAAAVGSGRLVRALEASGLDPVDLTGAVAGDRPPRMAALPARGRDELAERRARRAAERAAADAERQARDAERDVARAEARVTAARERDAALRERLQGLERELARVRGDADAAASELREAERTHRESAERHRAARVVADRAAHDRTAHDPLEAAHGDHITSGPSVEG